MIISDDYANLSELNFNFPVENFLFLESLYYPHGELEQNFVYMQKICKKFLPINIFISGPISGPPILLRMS